VVGYRLAVCVAVDVLGVAVGLLGTAVVGIVAVAFAQHEWIGVDVIWDGHGFDNAFGL
jgi:hypothetical protein